MILDMHSVPYFETFITQTSLFLSQPCLEQETENLVISSSIETDKIHLGRHYVIWINVNSVCRISNYYNSYVKLYYVHDIYTKGI